MSVNHTIFLAEQKKFSVLLNDATELDDFIHSGNEFHRTGATTLKERSPLVCRLVYICIHFCYTLANHDYFLRNTYLTGKNVVAIFSVWSRGHFQHKMYKNMNITRKN